MQGVKRSRRGLLRAAVASLFDAVGGGGGGGEPLPPPPLPGLAMLHTVGIERINPLGSYVLRVPKNGQVVKLTRIAGSRGESKRPRLRGKIKGLSRAAGLRLRRSMLAVDVKRVGAAFFVTNTIVAGEFGWPEVKKFLKDYRGRFEYRFPGVSAYWVKELTQRGTPHLHFAIPWPVGKAPSVAEFRAWNDRAWDEVVKSKAPTWAGGRYACRVEVLRSWRGASSYLSAYLSEDSTADPRQSDSGKMWGIIGKRHLPVVWLPEVKLSAAQGKFVQRALLRLQRRKRTYWLQSSVAVVGEIRRGSPFKWLRVRPLRLAGGESIDERLALLVSHGVRVKRVRPKCVRRVVVPLWSWDEESGEMERNECGDELHCFSSGWHHVSAVDVLRLCELAKEL